MSETTDKLAPGDAVVGANGFELACGSGRYPFAVVVGTNPLVLVSEHGDMLWSATISESRIRKVGRASCNACASAFERYVRDIKNGAAQPQRDCAVTSSDKYSKIVSDLCNLFGGSAADGTAVDADSLVENVRVLIKKQRVPRVEVEDADWWLLARAAAFASIQWNRLDTPKATDEQKRLMELAQQFMGHAQTVDRQSAS